MKATCHDCLNYNPDSPESEYCDAPIPIEFEETVDASECPCFEADLVPQKTISLDLGMPGSFADARVDK